MTALGATRVQIWTDGACSGNPGPGGWGALLRYGAVEKELCGGEHTPTTNNRMELTAPIRALTALTRASVVDLYTDSTYVRNGITEWVARWKRNGWRTRAGQPVKNEDLWRRLDAAVARHTEVVWHWVKGHAGNAENERADRLAARGQLEALQAAGVRVPVPQGPRREASPRRTATDDGTVCRATTKVGKPCPIRARPSGYCHVHDPAVQCGAPTGRGTACGAATGGGRCEVHRHVRTTVQALVPVTTSAWAGGR